MLEVPEDAPGYLDFKPAVQIACRIIRAIIDHTAPFVSDGIRLNPKPGFLASIRKGVADH